MRAALLVCSSLLVACGRPAAPVVPLVPYAAPSEPVAVAADSDPETPAADLAPSRPANTAAVTGKMIADAYQNVSVFGPWDEVMADFTNRIGAPTYVGKPTRAGGDLRGWAVVEQDSCFLLTLYVDANGTMQSNYGSFQRGQPAFADCAEMTAKL
ncbi:MAG: hypothetical protein SFX73_33815 [Kofleriaceae bacterium]|nr:hypothetical protein [Kofleriaceae bacterium]